MGAHQPIVSVALFERVQDIKSGKNVKKLTRHNHLYRGLFRCQHCGRSLIGELQKRRVYYRCQTAGCKTKTVREDVVCKTVTNILQHIALSPEDRAAVYWRLPEMVKKENDGQEVAALALQKDQIAARLDRLTDMHLDGLVDAAGFHAKKEALLIEQRRIEELLNAASRNIVKEANVRKFLELTTSLAELYDSGTKPEKRRIVEWATSNRRATGKSVCFEPSKWLEGTKTMLGVLLGGQQRDNSRIFDPSVLRSTVDLELPEN